MSLPEQVGPLGVIAAPLLWPIAAILQLLFPVILREQARAYRWACVALVTESTLLTIYWLVGRWWPQLVGAWVTPDRLLWAVVGLIVACTAAAWWRSPPTPGRPHLLEWAAFGTLFVIFMGRAVAVRRLDLGTAVGIAAACAVLHLTARRLGFAPLTTQRLFLTVLCLASAAAAEWPSPADARREPTGLWPTFHGDAARTGSLDPSDAGPSRPRVLWRYRCPGDSRLYASPAVAGGEVIVAATRTHPTGRLINTLLRLDTDTGRFVGGLDLPRAGISSPAVRGPLVVLGEGYHEDQSCRLRVVDRRSGATVGWVPTASHVESSPTLNDGRAYFGAGEDGVYGVQINGLGAVVGKALWQVTGHHVDASPLVADGTVFVGSIPGDANPHPAVLAIDASTGAVRWTKPTPLPVIAAPAFDGGRLFVALSNGKLNRDAERPAGAAWCLDPATGDRLWEFRTSAGLYASPVCYGQRVYLAGGDGVCRCLRQADGGQVWEASLGGRVVATPIVSGGAVFVLTELGLLTRLDAVTGQVVWRFDAVEEYVVDHDAHASAVLADSRIYLAAGGHVFCIGDRRE